MGEDLSKSDLLFLVGGVDILVEDWFRVWWRRMIYVAGRGSSRFGCESRRVCWKSGGFVVTKILSGKVVSGMR